MKKIIVICATVIALVITMTVASATEERTLEQRVADLEATVAALVACNPISCTYSPDKPLVGLPTGTPGHSTGVPPTSAPTSTTAPTAPPSVPTATAKPKCNQGVGNGPEGCDPGNSNHNQPSNDENPRNRGGKNVP